MNSGYSKTSDPHRPLLNFSDKTTLKRSDKLVALSNLRIYYTWKNSKKWYKKIKLKIPPPTWNEEFELPNGSYSVSKWFTFCIFCIHDYFEHILKKAWRRDW